MQGLLAFARKHKLVAGHLTGIGAITPVGNSAEETWESLKAGRSDTEMEPVEDERNSVYLLDNGQFYLATNFDKARENEKPSVDAYAKAN